jgi:hypothetical protein
VGSIEEVDRKLAAAGSPLRDDINALGLGKGQPSHVNAEINDAADGVIIDICETGWAGTAKHPR